MAGTQLGLQTGYNAPMNKVNTRFPGFSDEDIKKLEDKTKDIIDPIEKAKIQNELYRKVLPIVQQQKQLQARDEGLNELSYQAEQEKNQQKKSVINVGVKMGELGNAIKTKFNLPANAPDDEIIKQFIDQTRNGEQMLVDYINGKSEELLFVSGLKERPQTTTMQGGVKGGISRNSPVDMGQLEWINPIGKSVEELDNMVQKIGVVDFTKDRETALQQRIATLTPSELQDYKQEWEALKQNSPKIANLFQKTVKGKTLVGQMWNIITGDTEDLPQEEAFKNFVEEQEKSFVDQMVGVGTEGPKFANMMANIPGSTLKTITAIARGMTNPVDTMAGLYKLIATPEGRQALGERYGSWEALAKTMEQDPVGVASDLLTLAEGGAGIVKQGAKLAGATNLATKAGQLQKVVGSASDLGLRQAIPAMKSGILSQTKGIKGLKQVAKYAVGATEPLKMIVDGAKAIKGKLPTADETLQRMNRLTKGEQEKFVVQQGKPVGEWLNERGIVDTPANTVVKLGEYFTDNLKKVDDGLDAIQGKFQDENLKLMLDDSVRYAENTRNPQLNRIKELQSQYDQGGLDMKQINEVKRFFERNNKFSYGRDLTAGEKTAWATNVDSAVRDRQMKLAEDNGFTNLKELNKETQASKFIMDKLAKNENGRLGNNAVTITDWIIAAPAMIDPTLLAGLLGKKFAQSNWFAKNYAKILNKLNGHKTIANKVADMQTISKIQDEKAFQKWLDEGRQKQPTLPYKEGVAEGGGKVIDNKKIIVSPEGKAVREGQILEINKPQNDTSNISSNSNIDNTKIEGKTPVKQAPKQPKPLNKETTTQLKATVKAPEEPLYAEARKYKSAEEFVDSQGETLYHGTSKKFDNLEVGHKGPATLQKGLGIWLTPDKKIAKNFTSDVPGGIQNGRILETKINIKKPKVYEPIEKNIINKAEGDIKNLLKEKDNIINEWRSWSSKNEYSNNYGTKYKEYINKTKKIDEKIDVIKDENILTSVRSEAIAYKGDSYSKFLKDMEKYDDLGKTKQEFINDLKKQGYDSIIIKNTVRDTVDDIPKDQILVFDHKNIKTKSQLKQIREEANSKGLKPKK